MDKYIGKMLDNRYEILEMIGNGGMAVVYKARCHRLNRFVAVKILKDELAQDAEFRRRFHAESQAVAMLSHPNIVSVYDVSRSSDVEYIVMELIDGITLKQYMERKGVLSWKEALHFATQIVKGLSHAHSRGIIHRDIKPQNIMVLRDGSVKVADFGIARLSSTQNTLTQEALGSVHYISPEQAKGSYIDERSDLYSVGVVLYEMITGRLPFEGDSPVSVAIQHINSMPLTPREINPEIPEALELITMKAMAADMSKRYESADEMLEDLEEFRKNPSISFEYNMSALSNEMSESEPTRAITPVGGRSFNTPRGREYQGDYQDEKLTRRNHKGISFLPVALLVLAFVGVVLYFLWTTFISSLFVENQEYEVPNFIGLKYEDVILDPEYTDKFNIVEASSRQASDEYDEGYIIDQTPVAGRNVRNGATITVTVSSGKETITMPDLYDVEYRTALRQLDTLGVSKLGITPAYEYEFSDTITEGYVTRTVPAANTALTEGQTVTIYVSKGPESKMVTVPSLIGMTREQAESALEQAGLKLGTVDYQASDSPSGTVIAQGIKATMQVAEGTAINITVSSGPSGTTPTPTPTATTTTTPDEEHDSD